jgi:hypothetical protein
VGAMVAEKVILRTQDGADGGFNGFISDTGMVRTVPWFLEIGERCFFKGTDLNHFAIEPDCSFVLESIHRLIPYLYDPSFCVAGDHEGRPYGFY